MIDRSHTAHEPHPTAAMDRQYRDTVISDFNEDEVVHIDLPGKRKVYSEAAYNKLLADRDRLRRALANLERTAGTPAMYDDPVRVEARKALKEDRDE